MVVVVLRVCVALKSKQWLPFEIVPRRDNCVDDTVRRWEGWWWWWWGLRYHQRDDNMNNSNYMHRGCYEPCSNNRLRRIPLGSGLVSMSTGNKDTGMGMALVEILYVCILSVTHTIWSIISCSSQRVCGCVCVCPSLFGLFHSEHNIIIATHTHTLWSMASFPLFSNWKCNNLLY